MVGQANVRELEHVIERTVVFCTQKTIEKDHIIFSGANNDLAQLSFTEMKARVVSQFETNYL